jgi:hypothetical protein
VVIAGHIASDVLGLNLLLDEVERGPAGYPGHIRLPTDKKKKTGGLELGI